MTKLYDYLNWAFAFVIVLSVAIFISNIVIYFKLSDTVIDNTQFIQSSLDDTKQIIREDLEKISVQLKDYDVQLDVIQWRTDWIADNLQPSHSWVTNVSNIQLVHYIAEVEICSDKYSSYKVKVDFYGINPRIESNRLLIIDERLFAQDYGYNVYFPILDKNTDYDANLCSIRIISSSNK